MSVRYVWANAMPTQLETTWTGCQSSRVVVNFVVQDRAEHHPFIIIITIVIFIVIVIIIVIVIVIVIVIIIAIVIVFIKSCQSGLYVQEYKTIHSVFLFGSSVRFITNWLFLS